MQFPYKLKRTVITDNAIKTYLSSYDPAKTGLQRWTLHAINDLPPSAKDVDAFNKEHATVLAYKIDETTLSIAKDNGVKLHISYRYDPASIDADRSFLKDCMFTAIIDIASGKLETVNQKNLKDLKIKIVKAVKLTGAAKYQYVDAYKTYLLMENEVVVVMKLLTQQIPMTTLDVYTYDLKK